MGVFNKLESIGLSVYEGKLPILFTTVSKIRELAEGDNDFELYYHQKTSERLDDLSSYNLQVATLYRDIEGDERYNPKVVNFNNNIKLNRLGIVDFKSNIINPSIRIELGSNENNEPSYWFFLSLIYSENLYKWHWAYTTYNDNEHNYWNNEDGNIADDFRTSASYNNYRESEEYPLFCLCILEDDDGSLYFGLLDGMDFESFYARYSFHKISDLPFENQTVEVEEIESRFGEISEPEGYPEDEPEGQFDFSSDTIGFDEMPDLSVSDMGFLNVYKVTKSSLQGLLEEVYPDLQPIPEPSNLEEGILWVGKQIERMTQNFLNSGLQKYIVDTHILPIPITGGVTENIQIGFREMTKTGQRLSVDYVDVDCGSVSIPQCHYNFIDLGTQIDLYLPFVGYVPINPELVLGGSVNVRYRFNLIDGSFVCAVTSTSKFSRLRESLVGNYSGCCAVHIPLTSSDYSSIVSGIVGTIGSVASGSATATGLNALNLAQSVTSGGGFSMSNGYNSSSGFLGKRTPYLLIKRPVKSFSQKFPHEKGLPTNVTYKLTHLIGTGFTQCDKPHIDGIKCSEKERSMIYNLLTSGIIL